MGNLAAEHEQNIEGGAMRKVLIKDFDTLQKDCGGLTTFWNLLAPKGYEKSFVPRMRPLCGREVIVNENGWVQGLTDFQNMRFESWMYDETEMSYPSADERLQHNEEHQRKKAEPPPEYLVPQPYKVDRARIKDAIKAGEKVAGFSLESTGKSLRVK